MTPYLYRDTLLQLVRHPCHLQAGIRVHLLQLPIREREVSGWVS